MTGNSTCAEIYYDQHSYLPRPSSAPLPLVEVEDRPIQFEGDFFGDYSPQDFEWRDHSENDLAGPSRAGDEWDNSNSDHSEDLAVDLERGWELEPLPPAAPPPGGDIQQLPLPDPNTRHRAEARFAQKAIIEKFNDHRRHQAGVPICTDAQVSSYQSYGHSVSGDTVTNIWAPFASRLDWDIARWAKVRGPGSTAFSELLCIEGVC
jgi:hypothetical protein